MSENTPGPWLIDGRTNTHVLGANGRHVATTGGFSTNMDNGEHHDENAANARLIAAAPSMLSILELFQKFEALATSDEALASWCRSMFAAHVRAAIANAHGEVQA